MITAKQDALRLIDQSIPRHRQKLHNNEGHRDRKQIPAPNMIEVKAISKEENGQHSSDDSSQACRPESVLEKTFANQPRMRFAPFE